MKQESSALRRTLFLSIGLVILASGYLIARRSPGTHETGLTSLQWLFGGWVVLFALHAIRVFVVTYAGRARAGSFAVVMRDHGIVRSLWGNVWKVAFRKKSLAELFITWSMVISAVIGIVGVQGGIDEIELKFIKPEDAAGRQSPDPAVRIFNYLSDDNNTKKYLMDMRKVSYAFEAMGAKAVVMERPLAMSPQQVTLVDSLYRSKVILTYDVWPFVTSGRYLFGDVSMQEGNEKRFPMFNMSTVPLRLFSPIENVIRWYPFTADGAQWNREIALVAAGRFLRYPDSLRPEPLRTEVRYGGLTIPVSSEGEAACITVPHRDFFLHLSASREGDPDSMKYMITPSGAISDTIPGTVKEEVSGKIILINRLVMNDFNLYPGAYARAMIIENILHGRSLERWRWQSFALSFVIIGLSALLCFRIRLRRGVPLILFVSVAVGAIGFWAPSARFLVINIAYPVMAGFLSVIIFPLVRMSREYNDGDDGIR